MKVSLKGVLVSLVATFGVAVVCLLPVLWLFPGSLKNIHSLPLIPALLLLAFGAFLNLFAGFVLGRNVRADEFLASNAVLAGVFAMGSLKAGLLWFLINFAISYVLMSVGKLFAGKRAY